MGSQTLIQVLVIVLSGLGALAAIYRLKYLRSLHIKGELSKGIFKFRVFLVSIIGSALGGFFVTIIALKVTILMTPAPEMDTNNLLMGVGIFLGTTFLLLIVLTSIYGRTTAPGK